MAKRSRVKVPDWLDVEAKAEFKRIIKILEDENRDFTAKDLKTLETYCRSYAKWRECENILMDKGYTFTTPNGYEQQRPEVSISNTAQQQIIICAKELGLTPAARARMNKNVNEAIKGVKSQDEKDMDEIIS